MQICEIFNLQEYNIESKKKMIILLYFALLYACKVVKILY